MIYSESISRNKDFYKKISNAFCIMYVNRILNNRYKAINYDTTITKEKIRSSILFDQYICSIVEKSRQGKIDYYELNAVRQYIKGIYKRILNEQNTNGKIILEKIGLVSLNEFTIFSSSFDQLKVLFQNDAEISNILNIISDEYKNVTQNVIFEIWNKYEKGYILVDDEIEILLHYFVANCPTNDKSISEMQEKFFLNLVRDLLIDNNGNNLLKNKNGILMLEFICKYGAFRNLFKLFSEEEIAIYGRYFIYCYDMKKSGVYSCVNDNEMCFGYCKYGTKVDSLRIEGLLLLLVAINHETRHFFQLYYSCKENLNNQLSSVSAEYQLHTILFKYDIEEYNRNYFAQENEHDANRNALLEIRLLLSDLESPKLKNMIEIIDDEIDKIDQRYRLSVRRDADDNIYIGSDYKFSCLDAIVFDNPSLVEDYDLLRILYNQNGTPKNPIDILSKCNITSLNCQHHGICFILDWFAYRNKKSPSLFVSVLSEIDIEKKEFIKYNMFSLYIAAGNEIYSYYENFSEDVRNSDNSINKEHLMVIRIKINQYIKLMRSISDVLRAENSYISDMNKMAIYEEKYDGLMNEIIELDDGNSKK